MQRQLRRLHNKQKFIQKSTSFNNISLGTEHQLSTIIIGGKCELLLGIDKDFIVRFPNRVN